MVTYLGVEMNLLERLKNKKIAMVSHVYAPSIFYELQLYLKGKAARVISIAHPFAAYCPDSRSWFRLTDANGHLKKEHKGREMKRPQLLVYFKATGGSYA
ncbi:hypothetical protein LCGC14_2919100, partial [marine sediment metagenome]